MTGNIKICFTNFFSFIQQCLGTSRSSLQYFSEHVLQSTLGSSHSPQPKFT